MASFPTASSVLGELSTHPHVGDLAARVTGAALAAAEAKDRAFPGGTPVAGEPLAAEAAETPYGNVETLITRPPENDGERLALGALVALGAAKSLPSPGPDRDTMVARLVWLATHTPADALGPLEETLGARASELWTSLGRVAAEAEALGLGRAEAVVAATTLVKSSSADAEQVSREARERTGDRVVARILDRPAAAAGGREGTDRLSGEIASPPRSAIATVLLAVTGILFVAQLARLLGRIALGYRRPATLRLSERGLELAHRTEMLGKVLRDREIVVPMANVSKVTREVRYARAGLYIGLFALVVGSYVGMGLLVDGARVPGGSAPLIGLGVLIIVLGLGIDFGLSALADSARGRCRLVVEPRKGRALCIGALDPTRADAMLTTIADRARGAT